MTPHKHAEVIKAWADGALIEINEAHGWVECHRPHWSESSEYRVKPEPPAKEYPKSSMTHAELIAACGTIGYDKQAEPNSLMAQGYERIANAAISHSIDAGQVQVRNADRDLKIAKAVQSSMIIQFCKVAILSHPESPKPQSLRVVLESIIASVKP